MSSCDSFDNALGVATIWPRRKTATGIFFVLMGRAPPERRRGLPAVLRIASRGASKKFRHFVRGQVFGLCAGLLELLNLDVAEPRQAGCDCCATGPAGVVFIQDHEHKTRCIGVLANQLLLCRRQSAAHESNDTLYTELPEFDAIEETFDNHQRLVRRFLNGPVKVEELLRFSKPGRKLVFRRVFVRWLAGPAPGVCE